MKVADRTFVVSGGSSGLGLATVQGLLAAEAKAVILDLRPPKEQFPADRVLFITADLAQHDGLEQAVDEAAAWAAANGAPLGGLVNCAGIGGSGEPIIDAKGNPHSMTNWERVMAVNVTGTFNLSRLVLRHLIGVPAENGDGERGVIILISSNAAYEGMPSTIAYAASKGAIRSLVLPMARDCARFGIRVVAIAPGPFGTPMTDQWTDRVASGITNMGLLFPRRYGAPEEFAKTVNWVLECAYINGESIKMTGGGRLPARL